MIKYECDQGIAKIVASGSTEELVADCLLLIHEVHKTISAENLFNGLFFENAVRECIDTVFSNIPGRDIEIKDKAFDDVTLDDIRAVVRGDKCEE